MVLDITEVIAFAAGICIMISFLPQLIKSIKTKKVEDLSFLTVIITILGTALYTLFGILIESFAVVLMQGAFLISLFCVLFIKIKFQKHKII